MTDALQVWTDNTLMADIAHEGRDDLWHLRYAPPWLANPQAFPLSPALPLGRAPDVHASATIKRFIEHLLPEGRALDVAVAYKGLTKSNVFGLIRALGAETAGALQFTGDATATPANESKQREIPFSELAERVAQREQLPLNVWDGQVRMSVAGLQDKLVVFIDTPLAQGGRLSLVEGQRMASTHILKPDTGNPKTPHLAVNEHFCMSLARRMGLPVADVDLLRTPRPVLVVRRFDRAMASAQTPVHVQRLHIIDACQACDLPVSYKYERNLGNAAEVRHIRDGLSHEKLFACADLSGNKASTRLAMLRWSLFQFLIGNSDAHGKNFSFFVRPGGLLEPTPWYDLVSVLQYDDFDTELAMAWGDVFEHEAVSPFALADFATRCRIDRKLLRREGQRLAKLAEPAAMAQALAADYEGDERAFAQGIASFVARQAKRLTQLVADAARIKAEYL
jgi:serine/threonine-protein kinase HipA